MLTDMHDKLVLKGDFDACEELIEKAVNGKTLRTLDIRNLISVFTGNFQKEYMLLTQTPFYFSCVFTT